MQVIHVPEDGVNFVPYEVSGNVISFDDDEISVNLKKKERDDDVTLDVCRDFTGGLVLSPAGARVYVAQVFIPAQQYTDTEIENPDYDPEDPSSQQYINQHEPVPFSMDNVTLTLYEEV